MRGSAEPNLACFIGDPYAGPSRPARTVTTHTLNPSGEIVPVGIDPGLASGYGAARTEENVIALLEADLFGVLGHPTRPRVLLLGNDAGWQLPCVRVDGQVVGERDLGIVSARFGELLGGRVNAYRSVTYRLDRAGE